MGLLNSCTDVVVGTPLRQSAAEHWRGLEESSLGYLYSRILYGDFYVAAQMWWYIRPLNKVKLSTRGA